MTKNVSTPFELEDGECIDITLESSEEKARDVKNVLDENRVWKVTNENYELLESTARIITKYHPEGIDLFYYQMKQKNKPKAVIFTFHGYGGSQRIDASLHSNYLAAEGFEVIGFENEAHGRNIPKKEDRCFIDKYNKLPTNGVSFIEWKLEQEKIRYEGIPIFLWGMSMGGAIVSSILINEDFKRTTDKLSGAILNAPAIEMVQKPGWLAYQALVIASSIFPKKLFPSDPKLKVTHYGKESRDWFQNHEDSYCDGVRIATGRELVRMGEYVRKNANKIRLPLLLFHGTKDNMCKFSAAEKFFRRVSSKKKTFVRLKDMLHGITGDRCCLDMVDILLQWLRLRIKDNIIKEDEEEEEEVEGEDDDDDEKEESDDEEEEEEEEEEDDDDDEN